MVSSLPTELRALEPFHHDIELDNGIWTNDKTRRIRNSVAMFFPVLYRLCGGSFKGLRFLDLGCNCGGFAVALARLGAEKVVGIDAREEHVSQANVIRGYLKLDQLEFIRARLEDVDNLGLGEFDVTLMMGIAYHLRDPIGTFRQVGRLTRRVLAVDSHVHFSSDANVEDFPKWWMLRDTDFSVDDGIYDGPDENITREAWREFQRETHVDYTAMPDQFRGSPHTQRDIKFSRRMNPDRPFDTPKEDGVHAAESGSLVMVPNRRALIEVVRDAGFEDVVDVVPRRFDEPRYLLKYRVGMFGLKRSSGDPFPLEARKASYQA